MREEIIVRGKKQEELYSYFVLLKERHRKGEISRECVKSKTEDILCIESDEWKVYLYSEGIYRLGSLVFPEVKICFEGEKEMIKKIIAEFRLEFLTMGG